MSRVSATEPQGWDISGRCPVCKHNDYCSRQCPHTIKGVNLYVREQNKRRHQAEMRELNTLIRKTVEVANDQLRVEMKALKDEMNELNYKLSQLLN